MTEEPKPSNRPDDTLYQVTVEVRRRLCVMNVHILLKTHLQNLKLSVHLTETSIILHWNKEQQQTKIDLESVIMMPETVSCLVIKNNWISFRTQICPENLLGSFGAQLLGNDLIQKDEKTWTLSSAALPKKDHQTTILCSNCKTQLAQTEFHRVLPLPSGETFDYFCCSHSGESKIDKSCLIPKPNDYFYTSYYALLNRNIFSSTKVIDDSVRCKKCLSDLGVTNNPETVKLWNSSVLKMSDQIVGSEPLNDFLVLMKEFSNRFMGEALLIETKENGLYKFVMIKLMDKKLELLTEDINSIKNVLQKLKDVSKVMFLYDESDKSVINDQSDANYHFVSPLVLAAGLDHLIRTSSRYPPYYRTVDQWIMGYVDFCSFVNHHT